MKARTNQATLEIPAHDLRRIDLGHCDHIRFLIVPDAVQVSLNDGNFRGFIQGETITHPAGSGLLDTVVFKNDTGDAQSITITFGDGNLSVQGTVTATIVGGLTLPSGAATAAKQDTGNTSLASMDTKTPALSGGKVPVTDPTALPLPTGAATAAKQDTLAGLVATAAKQDTGNTSLAAALTILNRIVGTPGVDTFNDTGTHTLAGGAAWASLQFVQTAQIEALIESSGGGVATAAFNDAVIPAGTILPGSFVSLKLKSYDDGSGPAVGLVRAFRA